MTSFRFQRRFSYDLRPLHNYNWDNSAGNQKSNLFSSFIHDIPILLGPISECPKRSCPHLPSREKYNKASLFGLVGLPD